jgi:hypothetical protein
MFAVVEVDSEDPKLVLVVRGLYLVTTALIASLRWWHFTSDENRRVGRCRIWPARVPVTR